jgi:hypothetical protein
MISPFFVPTTPVPRPSTFVFFPYFFHIFCTIPRYPATIKAMEIGSHYLDQHTSTRPIWNIRKQPRLNPLITLKTTMKNRQHAWVTPLSAVTGLLLLFKMQFGQIKFVHEWLSLAFVVCAIVHVAVNWRSMTRSFAQPRAQAILAVFALLICAAFLLPGEKRGAIPPAKSLAMFQHFSLVAVAQIAERTPEEAVQLLEKQGIRAETTQGVDEIAAINGKKIGQVIGAVFQN